MLLLTFTIPIGIISGMDNRSTILNCALELFSARGYDAVGVQEVVEAAGVTKPTLYHYFGSKQGLLHALLETYHAPLNEAVRTAAEYKGDLTSSLETLTQTYFDFARQHPRYYRMQLAMYFSPQDSEAFQQVVHWNEEQHRLVEKMFADAVKNHGNMRGRQLLYAATFIGLINTCIGMGLNGYLEMDEALTYRVVHQFQHGIYS